MLLLAWVQYVSQETEPPPPEIEPPQLESKLPLPEILPLPETGSLLPESVIAKKVHFIMLVCIIRQRLSVLSGHHDIIEKAGLITSQYQ